VTGRRLAALAALAAGMLAAGVPAAASAGDPGGFTFADQRIDEASALVALPGGLFATTNDSGDTGRVFTVDAHGRTVGTTQWEQHPRDVEALAPAPDGGNVWVGDIGDNSATRPHVQVAEVPVGTGERSVHPTVYTLVYPDGAHDAETLLCDPQTGRLYVATKNWFGGTLYAAPAHLVAGRDNPLTPIAPVLPMATDGVFLPGGHEVLVRGYFSATTYAWPSMDKIASFPLPRQPQGEGVGVLPDGTVYLSSEGVHSQVLRFELPAKALTPAGSTASSVSPTASASAATPAAPTHPTPTEATSSGQPWWPWALGGLAGAVIVAVLLRSLRPR
jgi:hypothetical protein